MPVVYQMLFFHNNPRQDLAGFFHPADGLFFCLDLLSGAFHHAFHFFRLQHQNPVTVCHDNITRTDHNSAAHNRNIQFSQSFFSGTSRSDSSGIDWHSRFRHPSRSRKAPSITTPSTPFITTQMLRWSPQ